MKTKKQEKADSAQFSYRHPASSAKATREQQVGACRVGGSLKGPQPHQTIRENEVTDHNLNPIDVSFNKHDMKI